MCKLEAAGMRLIASTAFGHTNDREEIFAPKKPGSQTTATWKHAEATHDVICRRLSNRNGMHHKLASKLRAKKRRRKQPADNM